MADNSLDLPLEVITMLLNDGNDPVSLQSDDFDLPILPVYDNTKTSVREEHHELSDVVVGDADEFIDNLVATLESIEKMPHETVQMEQLRENDGTEMLDQYEPQAQAACEAVIETTCLNLSLSPSGTHHTITFEFVGGTSTSSGDSSCGDNSSEPPEKKQRLLELTPAEKQIAANEGFELPERYPLTAEQEKQLKKVRRKQRNKESARESRRKKQEFVSDMQKKLTQTQVERDRALADLKTCRSENTGRYVARESRRKKQEFVSDMQKKLTQTQVERDRALADLKTCRSENTGRYVARESRRKKQEFVSDMQKKLAQTQVERDRALADLKTCRSENTALREQVRRLQASMFGPGAKRSSTCLLVIMLALGICWYTPIGKIGEQGTVSFGESDAFHQPSSVFPGKTRRLLSLEDRPRLLVPKTSEPMAVNDSSERVTKDGEDMVKTMGEDVVMTTVVPPVKQFKSEI